MEQVGNLFTKTSQPKPTRNAHAAKEKAQEPATQLPAEGSRANVRDPWRRGVIGQTEAEIRWALTGLRKRGLRNLKKYPPEPWEPPLTEQERERFK